ncbi:hypothetical protein BCF33_1535 [Hasllibacter halocynthiae]|uniref:Lipoprotein n=1 Tax=Hasllibacter halocynthiae TaxID=595589 RepID=A0A2T0X160_9RHOB|nr:hypothetical protein [Hasllibacter halocynthiae]PRY92682.1 hypothetical protein BCF33_1535 [Hasllibacter halocynthiae]
MAGLRTIVGALGCLPLLAACGAAPIADAATAPPEDTVTIVPIVEPASAAITVPASQAPARARRAAGGLGGDPLGDPDCNPDAILQGGDLYCP